MARRNVALDILLLICLTFSACASKPTPDVQAIETQTAAKIFATQTASVPEPTNTPTSTNTPLPTDTPSPSSTVGPSSTPRPTNTPKPTMTVLPSDTPRPTLTATATYPQVVASKVVNLRAGPGTSYPTVGAAKAGDRYDITARNQDGSWFEVCCVNSKRVWVARSVVTVSGDMNSVALAQNIPPPPTKQPASAPATTGQDGQRWTLVADAAADFPGGNDRNYWYYLWTPGRNSFAWQDTQRSDNGCYRDGGGLGMEICRDMIKADPRGDIAVQWKANRGGTYKFEWDSASLKFYKHANLVGILSKGAELPYAATIEGVIDWELFFWVAADSTPYHIRVFRLDETTAAQAAPASPALNPSKAGLAFSDGTGLVGVNIPAGTYRSIGRGRCYWERLRGFGGTLGEIIANDYSYGPKVVTISANDAGFHSWGCNGWTLDLTPITANPMASFGSGTYFVHKDVAPGTWQSNGTGSCYWERLSGFSGEFKDILANDYVTGPTIVAISPGDTGFSSYGCGTWTRIK